MTSRYPRVFLRVSDINGLSDQEIEAIFASKFSSITFTRASPSPEYPDSECAIVTLPGKRQAIAADVLQLFDDYEHHEREPRADFDFESFTPLTSLPDCPLEDVIDVIAVSGLGANAFVSWQGHTKHHRTHWLRDYLPQDLPCARVWTYGYNSDLSDRDSMAGTLEFAELLQQELVTLVEQYKMRRVILMGHSLGCILIKKALVDLPNWHPIFRVLIALVFFGAPHKGFDITALSSYAFETLQQERAQVIVSELSQDSAWLKNLHRDFLLRLDDPMPHVFSVYETVASATLARNPTTGEWTRTGPRRQAVTLASAILGVQERFETKLSAPYDHSGIAKLTKDNKHVYHRLLRCFKQLVAQHAAGQSYSHHSQPSNANVDPPSTSLSRTHTPWNIIGQTLKHFASFGGIDKSTQHLSIRNDEDIRPRNANRARSPVLLIDDDTTTGGFEIRSNSQDSNPVISNEEPTSSFDTQTTPQEKLQDHSESDESEQIMPSITFISSMMRNDHLPATIFEEETKTLRDFRERLLVRRHTDKPFTKSTYSVSIQFKSLVISRRHAEFSFENGCWYLQDTASSSGTWLNGIRLSEPCMKSKLHLIKKGDTIKFGTNFHGGNSTDWRHRAVLMTVSDLVPSSP